MGECELCGAVKVSVRRVQTGKTEVTACSRCVEKLNLGPKGEAPGLARAFLQCVTPLLEGKTTSCLARVRNWRMIFTK